MNKLLVVRAPFIDYETCLSWQEQLVEARQLDRIGDVLLVVTHPAVYTAGKHAEIDKNLLGTRPDIPVVKIDRGGDLTYHGPGQVVAYPILYRGKRGVAKAHVEAMEQAVIDVCAKHGVKAFPRDGYPGVWVDSSDPSLPPAKICAVGVRITNGVTKHGLAFNIAVDFADYEGIIPCGITAEEGLVTSLSKEGVELDLETAKDEVIAALAKTLSYESLEDANINDLLNESSLKLD